MFDLHPLLGITSKVLSSLFLLITTCWVCRSIYRLYFHPLGNFPGPKFAAISDIWFAYNFTGGRWAHVMEAAHMKYGPVVRISPRELSFATADSYRTIYQYSLKDNDRIFIKSDQYANRGIPSVQSERDPWKHSQVRKRLSPAFSPRALRDQESVVREYVDLFIERVGSIGSPGGQGIDIKAAFEWLTFDIIGDLVFGESFGAVAAAESNFWISLINGAFYLQALGSMRSRVPIISLWLMLVMPKGFMARLKLHAQLTEEKMRKRLELADSRQRMDFFSHLFEEDTDVESIYRELLANSSILMIAGSETTKTFLISVVWLLLRNPDTLGKLRDEIRSSFSSYRDITADSAANLEYLGAVIAEGLRVFPPVAPGLSRVVPHGGAKISGYYVPSETKVSTMIWATHHHPEYWHEAHSFIPERWIGKGFGDNKEAFQPFLLGPRNCVGINLAYLEMRIILATLLYKYDWELISKDVDIFRDGKVYALWQMPSINVAFHPRSYEEVKTDLE